MRAVVRLLILLSLIVLGVYRSAVTTRLDSFMLDEYYHIAAGASYVRLGDYRLNPEHPPLVKLWAGMFFPPGSFLLPPLRAFTDKVDERHFTADAVYFENDPEFVQSRARTAMFVLNGLLLLILALTIWRLFGYFLAVTSLGFLLIDPTVAAHMPVVMTDLPVALLATTAVLWSSAAFRSGRIRDIVCAGLALGLTLTAKHSALVVVEFVAALGILMLFRRSRKIAWLGATRRLFGVVAVLALALVVLWGFYGFRFRESAAQAEVFNRPIVNKIEDLSSPSLRSAMSWMAGAHVAPRAYLWGLADTLRAGVEGRPYPIYFINREYVRRVPLYYFPFQIISKLPIGLLLLSLAGIALLIFGFAPVPIREPLWVAVGFAGFFLLTIALANSGYAGVRHALPVYPACALLAGTAVLAAVRSKSRLAVAATCLALVASVVSAIPAMRPWEYRNEIFGGPAGAYRFFSDEGLDVGQRTRELAGFYHQRLEPAHELPYLSYSYYLEDEFKKRGIRTLNQFWDEHEEEDNSDVIQGTIILGANIVSAGREIGLDLFRNIQPTERYGNLLIFRGVFHVPKQRAWRLYLRGIDALYSSRSDPGKAERLFQEALVWNPESYASAIELGNLRAGRGARDEAIQAFEIAKAHAPLGETIGEAIARQISLLGSQDPRTVPPLRDPILE